MAALEDILAPPAPRPEAYVEPISQLHNQVQLGYLSNPPQDLEFGPGGRNGKRTQCDSVSDRPISSSRSLQCADQAIESLSDV